MDNYIINIIDDFNNVKNAIKIGDVITENDGDVCNACITYELLKNAESPHCFDIGVDRGWWSSFVLDINKDSTIDAFEPNPITYNLLKFPSNVSLHNIAISDKDGSLVFKIEGENSHSRDESGDYKVICKRIDSFLGNKHLDLMKIDTEGHDLKILNTLDAYFSNIDSIIFEFSVYWYGNNKEECIADSILLLTKLKEKYSHMYCLSRNGPPRIFEIDANYINSLCNFCYEIHLQIDILVTRHHIQSVPSVDFSEYLFG